MARSGCGQVGRGRCTVQYDCLGPCTVSDIPSHETCPGALLCGDLPDLCYPSFRPPGLNPGGTWSPQIRKPSPFVAMLRFDFATLSGASGGCRPLHLRPRCRAAGVSRPTNWPENQFLMPGLLCGHAASLAPPVCFANWKRSSPAHGERVSAVPKPPVRTPRWSFLCQVTGLRKALGHQAKPGVLYLSTCS
jgi:hypothetical protein